MAEMMRPRFRGPDFGAFTGRLLSISRMVVPAPVGGWVGLNGLRVRHALRDTGLLLNMRVRPGSRVVSLCFGSFRGCGLVISVDDTRRGCSSEQNGGDEGRGFHDRGS